MCSGVRRLCIVLIINNLIGGLLVMINSPIHYISNNHLGQSCNRLRKQANKHRLRSHPNNG